jgi:GT2 family glycosyltransferase
MTMPGEGTMPQQRATDLGVVIFGRNEGDRLRRCLQSVRPESAATVYVDSGSSDGSVELALRMGMNVLALDPAVNFTAARACNAGWQALLDRVPAIQWLQFLAGDCELAGTWLETGRNELQHRPDVGVVCGRLREKAADASVFGRLIAIEWDAPTGDDVDCAGVAMMRVSALREVGGFNAALIAGEEPELCLRMRSKGWKTVRTDAEMGRHEMAMHHWTQWWRRAVRAGYGYAAVAWLHRRSAGHFWFHESASIWFWGLLLPLLTWGFAWPTRGLSLLLLLGYPALALRIVRRLLQRGYSIQDGLLYAASCMVGKFPQLEGQMRFLRNQWTGRVGRLIEYK